MTELNDVKRKVLKYDEYCGTIEILDDLYKKSRKGMTFNKLYELIIDENNIMRAYRTIKRNTGSKTKGVNGHTIKYLENLTKAQLIWWDADCPTTNQMQLEEYLYQNLMENKDH